MINNKKSNRSPLFNIQVGPGARYFYFLSLAQYENNNYKNMNKIVQNTQKLFQPKEINSKKQITWNKKLNAIISLLDEFEKYETNNDKIVFETAIKPLLKQNPTKFAEFQNIFEGDSIDYIGFMTLLTILNTDIETAKFLIHNLNSVMKDFNQSFDQAIKIQQEERAEKTGTSVDPYIIAKQQYAQLTSEAYNLMKGSRISILSSNMAAISSDLSKLQDDKNDLLKQSTDFAIDALTRGQTEKQVQLKNDAIRIELLQQIRLLAASYNKDIIEMLNYITDISNRCSILENNDSLSKRDQEVIINLQKHLESCLNNLDIIQQQYDEIDTILHGKVNSNFGTNKNDKRLITGFTSDVRKRILDTIEDEKDRKKLARIQNRKDFNIQNIKDFNQYLTMLKKILKKESNDDLLKELDKRLAQTTNKVRTRRLTTTSETRGALDLAKIFHSFIAESIRTGSGGIKTDTKTIGYINIEDLNDDQIDKLIKNIQEKGKNMGEIMTNEIKNYNKETFGIRNVKYTTKGDLQSAKIVKSQLLENVFDGDLVELENVSKVLSNIFEIDNSIKFFETFNTASFGFEGGSLGDIESAITNINDMLTIGGITPLDAKFLTTAIMNSGAGMLGHDNLNSLEYYLTSVASLCMFNTGGAALQDWSMAFKARIDQLNSAYTGSRKIHIFQLNTIFVPLAYILQLIKQGIMECAKTIYQHADLKGAQVIINNPVTEENTKVSQTYTTHDGKSFPYGDWEATTAAGLPKITIDMTIMGGFLDILDQIEAKLNSLTK